MAVRRKTSFGIARISMVISKIILHGGDLQNVLCKFVRFFVTLGLKILRLFRLKVLLEAGIIKG